MTITKLGDAKSDFDAWLEVRKDYLSSSEIFTWIGNVPDWWGDRREDVMAGKQGVQKVFDPETQTSIEHGSFDEENILRKFGHAVGCTVYPDNGFFVNDTWPGIGASIDGLGEPASWGSNEAPEVHPEFSQDRTLFPYLRTVIDDCGEDFITEVKKSTSTKWQSEVPEYYVCQVQTQLHVLEKPYAIIMAETIKRGATQKWRLFWDMRAYVIEYDPAWADDLTRMSDEFLDAKERMC
jgi:hypothetical protein